VTDSGQVTVAWLLTGTTPRGRPVEARGCDLFEFRGDRIARKDPSWKLVEP
jgi:hypothetical protein